MTHASAGTQEAHSAAPGRRALSRWAMAFSRRVPWVLLLVAAVGSSVGKIYEYRSGTVPADGYLTDSLLGLALLLFPAIGALIVSRRWNNGVGWVLIAIGVMVALLVWGMGYSAYQLSVDADPHPLWLLAAWLEAWLWLPMIMTIPTLLFLLFPDGRLPSPRWRWVSRSVLFLIAVFTVASMVREDLARGRLRNPIGIEGWTNPEGSLGFLFVPLLVLIVFCVASVFVRYRRGSTEQRQQLKWFAFAAAFVALGMIGGEVLGFPEWLFPLVLMTVPISIGVAVLKYRLYDIDAVINRTLVYGALSAILALVYLATVVVLQQALGALTEDSDLAIAASTLAVASLFRPLRARIQSFIDQRFYRRKYDATETLGRFSTQLRDQVDLQALNQELLAVVKSTIQPAHASLWLRPRSGS